MLYDITGSAIGLPESGEEVEAERENTTGTATLLLFIYVTVLAGIVFKYIIELVRAPFPFELFLLLIGTIIGVLANQFAIVNDDFMMEVQERNEYLLIIALPLLIYKQCLCMEVRSFVRCLTQVIIISIPCTLINGLIVACIMGLVQHSFGWTIELGIVYGFTCVPVYPQDTLKHIRELGMKGKHISDILDGEVIFGTAVCIIMVVAALLHSEGKLHTSQDYCFLIFQYILGGFVIGCIAGYFINLLMKLFHDDAVNLMIVSVSAPFMIYYICLYILHVCGIISLIVVGIWMSFQKPELVPEIETALVSFWELLSLIINAVVFTFAGILFGIEVLRLSDGSDIVITVIAYMVVYFSRVGTFILFSMMTARLKNKISLRHMITAAWGGARGATSLCLVMIAYQYQNQAKSFKNSTYGHVTGIVLLSLLINVPTVPCLLNCLGLSNWSLAKLNNMNSCIRHIMNKRDLVIALLKMDRFLADANWSVVNSSTVIKNPYKSIRNADAINDSTDATMDSFCPDCRKEISHPPTRREIEEMRTEAHMRVLKAKKISYTKQYENGMLSKGAFATLTLEVEVAQNMEDTNTKIENFLKLFRRKLLMQRIRNQLVKVFNSKVSSHSLKAQSMERRRIFHHVVFHPAYFAISYMVTICNIVSCVCELSLTDYEEHHMYMNVAKGLNWIFFLYFFSDILLKILAHTWSKKKKIHLRDPWFIFDFLLLLAMMADLVIDMLDLHRIFLKYQSFQNKSSIYVKLIRIVTLIRISYCCRIIYSLLLSFCDARIDAKMSTVYDIGKGFVKGEEEVLNMLDQMISHQEIRQEMREKMVSDKLAVTKELGLIQKEKPWIAITVKTKQAIRTILNNMETALEELRSSGWIDHMEYKKLMESVNDKKKYVRKMKMINSSPPRIIFQEVIWMGEENKIIEFLFKGVVTKIYEPGEAICIEGEKPAGIFIIITGLFKSTYRPNEKTLDILHNYGTLPVFDYITSQTFHRIIEEYIVSGNCIGELSFLTRRPYNASVIADTPSQVYILPIELLEEASKLSPDKVQGLEARMWKYISIKLALSILLTTPVYSSATFDKLRYALERCFVPDLNNFRVFMNTIMIEDIVLIEGTVVDLNTNDHFIAPCYIPRTVQKLSLVRDDANDTPTSVSTKLLIIPSKDVDAEEIMDAEEEVAEFYQKSEMQTGYYNDRVTKAHKRRRRGQISHSASSRKLNISDTLSYSGTTFFSSKSRNTLVEMEVPDLKRRQVLPRGSDDEYSTSVDLKQANEESTKSATNKQGRGLEVPHPFSVDERSMPAKKNEEKRQERKEN